MNKKRERSDCARSRAVRHATSHVCMARSTARRPRLSIATYGAMAAHNHTSTTRSCQHFGKFREPPRPQTSSRAHLLVRPHAADTHATDGTRCRNESNQGHLCTCAKGPACAARSSMGDRPPCQSPSRWPPPPCPGARDRRGKGGGTTSSASMRRCERLGFMRNKPFSAFSPSSLGKNDCTTSRASMPRAAPWRPAR